VRPVTEGLLVGEELEAARISIDAKHATRFIGQSVDAPADPLQDAWCSMVQEHMSGDGDCFFTGTYSDVYGYAHGLMKSRNVVKDFERFLTSQGLDSRSWVCAVELHKCRDILHLHALISGVGDFDSRVRLEQAWRSSSRGLLVTAEPLLDRGVSYCTKYALKGQNAADFEWSFAS